MTLPLSKCLHPDDYAELAEELVVVDRFFTDAREQHPARRWEYALALRAVKQHVPDTVGVTFADVGGAGSPFLRMVLAACHCVEGRIIDPDDPTSAMTLAHFVQHQKQTFDVVTCLSVLEHVEDLDQFLYHLGCLVVPGGLLVLTMDYQDTDDPDTKHFRWMRQRIIGPAIYRQIEQTLAGLRFSPFGNEDLRYPGPAVYDYSFASMVLRRQA